MSESSLTADDNRLLDWVHGNKDAGTSSEVGLASSLYRACLRTMGLLSKQYVASRKPSRGNKSRMVESHARLCLFGDGLLYEGALEHCLKVDDELRDVLIALLHRLGKTLLQGVECLYYAYDPVRTKEEIVSGLVDLVESTSAVVSQQNEPGDEESNSDSSESEDSEAGCDATNLNKEHILDALDTYTTSLMDLRPVLEQSLGDTLIPQVRRTGVQPPAFHVTDSARPYVLQVHDKFRDANTALVERLGEANWQRYVRLKEMAAAAENPVEGLEPEAAVAEVPKSVFQPISQFHDSGLGTSAHSQSLYPASNASHASFLSSATDAMKGRPRIPSTPMEVGEGKPFTCFICSKRLFGIRNRVDWKMHVFADLQPYICTFTDCSNSLTTYPTRQLWAEHELKTHHLRERYQCHDCSTVFPNEAKFADHLSYDHQLTSLNHTQLLATLSAARTFAPDPLSEQICPLCQQKPWTVQRDFITHLGKHLEEIALSSLPREDDGESTSDDETGTEIDANASTAISNKSAHFSLPLPQAAIPEASSLVAQLQLRFPDGRPLVPVLMEAIVQELNSKPPRDYAASVRVSLLFSGNLDLLPAFNQLLPPGFSFINCGNDGASDLFEVQTPHVRLPGNSLPKTRPVWALQPIPIITVEEIDRTPDRNQLDRKPSERKPAEKKPTDEKPLPYSKEYEENLLRAWFEEHLDHPYPTEEDKQHFMQRTVLTTNQIDNWFINARRHLLPSLLLDCDRILNLDPVDGPYSRLSSVDFGHADSPEGGRRLPRWSLLSQPPSPEQEGSLLIGYNYHLGSGSDVAPLDKSLPFNLPNKSPTESLTSPPDILGQGDDAEEDGPDEDEAVSDHIPGKAISPTDPNVGETLASFKLGKMQMDKDTEEEIKAILEEMDSQFPPEPGQLTLKERQTANHEMINIEQEDEEVKLKADTNTAAIASMKSSAMAHMNMGATQSEETARAANRNTAAMRAAQKEAERSRSQARMLHDAVMRSDPGFDEDIDPYRDVDFPDGDPDVD